MDRWCGDVASMENLRRVAVTLLAVATVLVGYLCIADLKHAELIGFRGYYENTGFSVATVYQGSPAEEAGLQSGDVIAAQDGRDVADWYLHYRVDRDLYMQQRQELSRRVRYEVGRDGQSRTLYVTPRSPGMTDIARIYGVRLVLFALLVFLMIVILRSRTREPASVPVMLTFGLASLWLLADIPDWWEFFSPVQSGLPESAMYLKKTVEILFLQLAVAFFVHVALVFPTRHPLLVRHPWLLAVNYGGPLLLFAALMLGADGGFANRLAVVHRVRLWINTMAMIAAAAIMLTNYRLLASPGDRVQIRWIVASLVLFVSIHMVLWNLPKMVIGHPLVPDYEWALLPMTLVPIAMTMSIVNHELFGIRGIIRGRIKLLNTLLDREKSMVVNRDRRIQEMRRELGELHRSLDQYRRAELGDTSGRTGSSITRLEQRFPEIREIRRERLLGASPKWEPIMERAMVAARGLTPVMIVGESGTGKTDLAWTVYRLGDRKERVYKDVSCAQFEHADPAFSLGRLFGIGTGHGLPNVPREGRTGLLEECDGGTLFLDDFDRLPLSVQDMLLHPLEGRSFDPGIGVGAARTVSVKFILATNRDPDRLIKKGHFRGDVLSRIGERIDIPSLRERPEDIPLLVERFLRSVCVELGHEITVVSPMAMNILGRYPYATGNARELQMEIRTAAGKAMLEQDKVLRAGYLSDRLRTEHASITRRSAPAGEPDTGSGTATETGSTLAVLKKHQFQVKAAEAELGYSHRSKTLSNHLRGICIEALSSHDWNARSAAATLVEIDQPAVRAKLQRKMERYAATVKNNVAGNTESRLYKNLPATYHNALSRMIDHLRGAAGASEALRAGSGDRDG